MEAFAAYLLLRGGGRQVYHSIFGGVVGAFVWFGIYVHLC
jgi:hypothetical protein